MSENQSQKFASIDELALQRTSKWNLTSDIKLLGLLRNTSDDLLKTIQHNLSSVEDLSFRAKTAANKVNNVITSILILTNAKFIENRVYDEDIKDIAPKIAATKTRTEPKSKEPQEEQRLIRRLDQSINETMEGLSSRFQISPDEMLDGQNKYNLLHQLYLSKNRFANRPLPYVIGTDDFLKDTFVGLKSEEDLDTPAVIDLQQRLQPTGPIQTPETESSVRDSSDNLFDGISISMESREDSYGQSSLEVPPQLPPPLKIPPPLHELVNPPGDFTDNSRVVKKLFSPKSESVSFPDVSSDEDDIFTRPANQTAPKMVDQGGFQPTFQFQDDKDDLFEPEPVPKKPETEPIRPEPTPRAAKVPSLTKNLFESDEEDNDFDIFQPKTTAKNKETKKTPKFDLSSDEDDFFTSVISKVPPVKPDTVSKRPDSLETKEVSPKKVESGLKSNQEMSNVINQLNNVLQKKLVSPSTGNESSNVISSVEQHPPVSSPTVVEEISSPAPTDGIDATFNSMLKHKSRLSASRQRKPPNRRSLRVSLSNHSIHDQTENESLPISLPVKIEPEPRPIPISEPEPEPTNIPESEMISKTVEKSTIFDSSSDDDDIFKKPVNLTKKPATPKVNALSLFDDEDDGEGFLKFEPKKSQVPVTAKTANQSTPKPANNGRSIFDDDSDDDLFKF